MGVVATMAGEDGMSLLAGLQTFLGVILAAVALGGVVVSWVKWIRPRLRARKARQEAFEAAILGRAAVLHPDIPGKVLAPAVPGIGERQARQEEQMASLVDAVGKIADTHHRVDGLEARLDRVEHAVGIERHLQGIESVQLLRTIETVANAQPPDGPEG